MVYDFQKLVIELRNKLVISQTKLATMLQVLIDGRKVIMNLLSKLKERLLSYVRRMILN